MKIAYDFGANNGDNIPYYLIKFDKVVAIEANPDLAKYIEFRFKKEIFEGKLIVENCVASIFSKTVDFYIHKTNSVLSQFPLPVDLENFEKINIISKKPSEIINTYGYPEYVKIDLEHTDAEILTDMFSNNIFPKYLSSECHDSLVFAIIVSSQKYDKYKLLDGKTINDIYNNIKINNLNYTFPFHSAGPMWEDIQQNAMDRNDLFYKLSIDKLGWKDIHAKRIER